MTTQCERMNEAEGAVNTARPLTRSTSTEPKEGLAVKATRICSFPDCGAKRVAQGLCAGHRAQMKAGRLRGVGPGTIRGEGSERMSDERGRVPADRGGVVSGDVQGLEDVLRTLDGEGFNWSYLGSNDLNTEDEWRDVEDIARAILASDWLAAHVQAARAEDAERLAAVEELADETHEAPIDLIHERCPAGGVGPGRECTACSAAGRAYLIGVEHVQNDILAALRTPDAAPDTARDEGGDGRE